ncbi:matrixin family metalloprotease [Hymenobacter psoromatis]|uniref:matrixin family metalloprotease n=1 Tax=Hymenobacter psoromatis TaxID=1484116 RepID=UPI001CC080D5|nr:matrixin family metalloprotease [Hymenobacter psoromatis]
MPACAWGQSACSLVPVALAQRVQEAPLIVEARVTSQQVAQAAGTHGLATRQQLEVFKVFKGELPAGPLSVCTPGGTLGQRREVVLGGAVLPVGAQGLFFLEPDPTAPGERRLYAGPQGFIQYDLATLAATEPFGRYPSVEQALYGAVAAASGAAYQQVQPNTALAAARQRLGARLAAVQAPVSISSFTPATLTAGTEAVLTINGTGFGSSQGNGYVQFRNADSPGPDANPTYTQPLASEYLSWTDTQIQVRVSSSGQVSTAINGTQGNTAGTGNFVVASGGAQATSPTPLTITYALNNITYQNGTDQNYRGALGGLDNNGGYTLQYSPSFPAAARAPFELALGSWACAAGMNRSLGTDTPVDKVAYDQINAVRFDVGTELPMGVLGLTHLTYAGCGSSADNTTNWVLVETDYTFDSGTNWNFGPGAPTSAQYDFQSVALHELGHGEELQHVISPTSVMNFSIANGQMRRTPDADTDVAGAKEVIDYSTSRPAADLCGNADAFVANTSPTGCTSSRPLPVVLTAFTARYVAGEGTRLAWTTATETGSQAFVVESQDDPASGAWPELTRVAAAGSSPTPRQYTALDARPLAGTRYYRLRQVDLDGHLAYSPVVSVTATTLTLAAYPNPAAGLVHLSGPLAAGATAQVRLLDATGRCLLRTSGPAGRAAFDLPLAGIPAGLYVLAWDGGAGPSYLRLAIEQ